MAGFVNVVPSDAALDIEFNVTDYMNSLFPTQQAYEDMDLVVGKLKAKMQRYDEDIQKEVRRYMKDKHKVQATIKQAQTAVTGLNAKIEEIKSKAAESEMLANLICKDIVVLDRAKNNLASSITTMRRLKMVFDAMLQLQDKANQRQYKAAANLLGALEQLVSAFLPYKDAPCVQELMKTRERLRTELGERVEDEFERYETMRTDRISSSDDTLILRDLCYIIETLGDTPRQKFVTWFVKGQLFDYKQCFRLDASAAQLENVERRYAWLRREFQYLDETYVNIFPDNWQMTMNIAVEFCVCTKLVLCDLLETSKTSLDVVRLVTAAKTTIEFEKELCERFPERQQQETLPDECDYVYEYQEEKSDPEDEGTSKYSVESIKKKWQKFKQFKEKKQKENQLKRAQKLELNPFPEQVQFKGLISSCFDPYLETIYVQQEDVNMKEVLDQLLREETWAVSEEESNKVLQSSIHLIYYLNEARKRCILLSKGHTFFLLFMLFKKYLGMYATTLSSRIGDDTIIDTPKQLSENDEHTVCIIVNTADYCGKTTSQITTSVARVIEERFKDRIDLTQEAEAFSVVTSKALKALACNLESKLAPSLNAMSKIKWGEVQTVGEQSEYILQIDTILQESVAKLHSFFSHTRFQYICDTFVSSFVDRCVIPHLYKCKRVSEYGAQQLSVDFATLKVTLLEIAGKPTPARYSKLVAKEIGKIEAILKLLFVPNDGVVDAYFALIPKGTEEELERVLKMKGTSRDEKNELLQQFRSGSSATPPNSQTPTATPPSTPPPSPGLAALSASLSRRFSLPQSMSMQFATSDPLSSSPPTSNPPLKQAISLKKLADLVSAKKTPQ